MKRSKTLFLSLLILMPLTVGCASTGDKKPTVFADKPNNIPADIPSQFLSRYERFVTGKEQKEFKKLLTEEEQQAFVDKFWLERDTNPATPENERKEEIDERIDDIANELFLSTPGVFGLSFRSNGGFRGDIARVYLLHGEPNAMDMIESNSFVPLMLWIYLNHRNGNILYAFLFHQKGGMGGSFSLFPQDAYKLDFCSAINEIMVFKDHTYFGAGNQVCSPNIQQAFMELQTTSGKGGTMDGDLFIWALFNFSQDGSLLQADALEPPKPALEIAKQSTARVTGEAPGLVGLSGTDYILASCGTCNSMIPGDLKFGEKFVLSVRRSDIDWRVVDDEAKVELKVRIVLENIATNMQLVIENVIVRYDSKNLIHTDASGSVDIMILTDGEIAKIPAGSYRVSVYVKNVTSGLATKKYNAWEKQFTK